MTQPKIDHLEAVRPDSILPTTVDGAPVYAFTLKFGDVQSWDQGNIGPGGKPNQRAEISYAPAQGTLKGTSPYDVREGMTQTYDVDYRFKAGFPLDQRWAVLTQFHVQDDHKAGVPNGFGGVTVHGSEITFDDPQGSGSYFARIPIKTDTWFRLRMAVKWSAGNDGYAKIVDRATGQQIGRYDGPTIASGEFKYVKQGLYRDGAITQDATVYESLIDINNGDLTATAPTPTAPATKKNSAPLDPSKPSVQPNDGARALMAIRDGLVALRDLRVQPQIDVVNQLLNSGPWTP